MLVDIEKLHAEWTEELITFYKEYMLDKHGKKTCQAAIVEIPTDDWIFHSLGTFNLPSGSGRLIMHMARFCRASIGQPEDIVGLNIKTFPEETFCLNALLTAAFPKNFDTECFRNHDGGMMLMEEDGIHLYPHLAFAGFGMTLINESRQILSPNFPIPDSQVLKASDGKFLTIIEQ